MRRGNLRPILLLLVFQISGRCQPLRAEISAAAGQGHLFRIEDNPIGGGLNLGAAVGLIHRSGLAGEIELNRTLGLSARRIPCGIINLPCQGSARQGVTGATVLSANIRYEFTRARVRPYVTGGVGALVSHGFSATVYASERRAILTEEKWSDTGLAVNFGAGFRIRVSRSLSLRPELRLYTASALSRANLSLLRPSLGFAWSW